MTARSSFWRFLLISGAALFCVLTSTLVLAKGAVTKSELQAFYGDKSGDGAAKVREYLTAYEGEAIAESPELFRLRLLNLMGGHLKYQDRIPNAAVAEADYIIEIVNTLKGTPYEDYPSLMAALASMVKWTVNRSDVDLDDSVRYSLSFLRGNTGPHWGGNFKLIKYALTISEVLHTDDRHVLLSKNDLLNFSLKHLDLLDSLKSSDVSMADAYRTVFAIHIYSVRKQIQTELLSRWRGTIEGSGEEVGGRASSALAEIHLRLNNLDEFAFWIHRYQDYILKFSPSLPEYERSMLKNRFCETPAGFLERFWEFGMPESEALKALEKANKKLCNISSLN